MVMSKIMVADSGRK